MTPESIAHYRILGKLGEGAMGAVYRAMDTKLNRQVAIKVVPEDLTDSPDKMMRFQREAHVLAALNHPNIAAIYGVEDRALVMELVEGRTLAGPLTVQEALPIIEQLIDALEYAHEKGIVHRDLKPANIMVTSEGRVKVLDFGLAKALAKADHSVSPALAARATMTGTIMGTTAYMSPEQARGWNLDKRTDIWTFGVLIWELLTGRRLFHGDSPSETLAAVFTEDPDLEAVPPRFRRLLKLCLTRDPRNRLRDISGARLLLDEPYVSGAVPVAAEVAPLPPQPKRLAWILTAALAVLSAVLGFGFWRATRPEQHPLVRLSVDLGPEATFSEYLTAAISPDGRRLVYVARGPDGKSQLATRRLDESTVTFLQGTEDATAPFFSPDGEWIGFFAAGKLKKVSVRGGASVALAEASAGRGASWGTDGSIVFSPATIGGLQQVGDGGGAARPLTRLPAKGEVSHRWPQVLPGNRFVLFSGHSQPAGWDTANIEALDLGSGDWKPVVKGGYGGRYLPTGHLLYVSRGTLFAVEFDAVRLETRGSPVPLIQDIGSSPIYGGSQFDVSQTGTLVYLRGQSVSQDTAFQWMDSAGRTSPLFTAAGTSFDPRFSPDGSRIAVSGVHALVVYDLARQVQSAITPAGRIVGRPVWSPDGIHLVHTAPGSGGFAAIFWIRGDGAGASVQIADPGGNPVPNSFSPDGRRLAYASEHPETHQDIWVLPVDSSSDPPKTGEPEAFLRTPANEQFPVFSSDGRWIAYMSDEGGTNEVYVRPYPPGPGKWQISSGGGKFPVWSRAARELFFETSDNRIMVAGYDAKGGEFAASKPRLWSETRLASSGAARNFDVAPDGRRLIMMPPPQSEAGSVHVTFLMNFFDEVRRRVQ